MRHVRWRWATTVALAVGAALAPAAFADQPTKEPANNADFTLAAGQSCSFPVASHFYGDKEILKTFSSGRVLVTGRLRQTLTNLDSGKTIDLNISGPGHLVENADGTSTLVLLGRSDFPFFSTDLVSRGFLLTSGQMTLTLDASGNVIARTITGNVVDLCAALS
jgi:hypothetical protein